jgi:hypothetical protein
MQEKFEDTKGIIRDRTPKKDMQEEIEDKKRSNQGPYTKEGHARKA